MLSEKILQQQWTYPRLTDSRPPAKLTCLKEQSHPFIIGLDWHIEFDTKLSFDGLPYTYEYLPLTTEERKQKQTYVMLITYCALVFPATARVHLPDIKGLDPSNVLTTQYMKLKSYFVFVQFVLMFNCSLFNRTQAAKRLDDEMWQETD